MSEKNVEVVRRGLQDVEVFWTLLDENVVWDLRAMPIIDLPEVVVGRDAVIGASRHYWGTWTDYRLDAEELIDAGSSVVLVVHEQARGKGSGVPHELQFVGRRSVRNRSSGSRWTTATKRCAVDELVGPDRPGLRGLHRDQAGRQPRPRSRGARPAGVTARAGY